MESTIKAQVDALQARISNLSATATPEELVWLSKAIEQLSAKTTVFDILAEGGNQLDLVTAAGSAKMSAVNVAGDTKLNAVNAAGNAKIDAVNAAGNAQMATLATALTALTVTKVAFADATPMVLQASIAKVIEVVAPPSLDFITLDITLPDASQVNPETLSYTIKNKSFAMLRIKNSNGTVMFFVSPKAWGKLSTKRASATDWFGADAPILNTIGKVQLDANGSYQAGRFSSPSMTTQAPDNLGVYPTSADGMVPVTDANDNLRWMMGRGTIWNGTTRRMGIWPVTADVNLGGSMPTQFGAGGAMWDTDSTGYGTPPLKYVAAMFGPQSTSLRVVSMNGDGGPMPSGIQYAGTSHNWSGSFAFKKGEYLVIAYQPSAATSMILNRWKCNPDGSLSAAGTVSIAKASGLVQVSDEVLMAHDGTGGVFYDMAGAGTSIGILGSTVNADLGSFGNQVGIYLGDNLFTTNGGIFKFSSGANTVARMTTCGGTKVDGMSGYTAHWPAGEGYAVTKLHTVLHINTLTNTNGALNLVRANAASYCSNAKGAGQGGVYKFFGDKVFCAIDAAYPNTWIADAALLPYEKVTNQLA